MRHWQQVVTARWLKDGRALAIAPSIAPWVKRAQAQGVDLWQDLAVALALASSVPCPSEFYANPSALLWLAVHFADQASVDVFLYDGAPLHVP
jgi:hypothetical protein